MKFRLVGKDFQSWKHFDLTVNGFTIIVGSSNRGKSAIVRSLRGILRNQVQDAFIRHGQRAVELKLEVENGSTAVLTRGKTTTYRVNGEDFAKLNGDVPQPIKDLKLGEITIGSAKLDPTFAGQFDSQFMMNLSPSELNSVFGLFSNTEQLNQGKKAINLNNTEINSQAKMLALEVQAGHTKIAEISSVLGVFESLKPKHDDTRQKIATAQTVQILLNQRIVQWSRVVTLESINRITPPSTQKVAKAHRVHTLLLHKTQTSSRVKTLRQASQVALPSTELVSRYLRLGKSLRQVQKLQEHIAIGSGVLSAARSVKWGLLIRRWNLLRDYTPLKKRLAAAPPMVDVNTDDLLRGIMDLRLVTSYPKLKVLVTDCKTKTQTIATELSDLHQQLHELTKDAISCPKCGYQFTKE
jgi:hypothetical protein